jgi:heat-inducible transcriptional repressor
MPAKMEIELTERQQAIILRVVEEYVATGQPVGSKGLVERTGMHVSPSTVRSELAELEQVGLLTHPHTSAGRVPTDSGYRYYASVLLERLEPQPAAFDLDLSEARREVEAALQATTEMLAQATRLLALVSAPPLQTETVRHVEVLLLQPDVAMVVVITSAGAVTKCLASFDEPVDPGLANRARQYLNEQLVGVQLGTQRLRQRLDDPGLSPVERAFVERLRPAFTEFVMPNEQRLYVGGAAGLLDDVRADEVVAYRGLLELLERRRALLDVLAEALDPRRPFVRVGGEISNPALHDLALVGAAYGISNRTLGAVSLVGPIRMDYEKAIRTVRAAASELSRFSEDLFGEN